MSQDEKGRGLLALLARGECRVTVTREPQEPDAE